jgi:hypothetical protein
MMDAAASSWTRWVLAWAICLVVGLHQFNVAWTSFNRSWRPDGNAGHVNIDLASQWLLARMIVTGQGRQLYDRHAIQSVLKRAYPRTDEDPKQDMSDVDQIMEWLVEGDGQTVPKTVGGSLYPPVHGMLFAPLGLLSPHAAYRAMQVLNLLLPLLLGWVAQRLSHGRVWCPVAALVLFLMPGYYGVVFLGQNALLTLLLLALGWWQMMRERTILAGVLWGMMAFKPVWAVAFLPVALLTGRWRMAAAMAVTGAVLVALTLPLVGVQTWFDWLAVCRVATARYKYFVPWVLFSRDLQGLVRRWFLPEPDAALPNALALAVWFAVTATTVGVTLWRRWVVRADAGPAAAFLLFGAWLSGFHFMYYDTLLTALPLLLLFIRPMDRKVVPAVALAALLASYSVLRCFHPLQYYEPIDTYLLLGLWAWCGVQVARAGKQAVPRLAHPLDV